MLGKKLPRKEYDKAWLWFIIGGILALLCTMLFQGVQIIIYGYRIHHYLLLLLVPIGIPLTLSKNKKIRGIGMFLVGFGLVAGLTDLHDLYEALASMVI